MPTSSQYQYDAAGRLTQRTDAGGNTRSYGWDEAGRLVLGEHKLAGTTLDQRIQYQYDQDDQLNAYQQQDGNGQPISSAAYTLDAQGRSTQSAVTYGKVDGGVFSFQLGQGFNADGQLQSQTYPDASQQTITYTQGRLAQITLPNQSQIGYQAYQWMQPTRIVMPGATTSQTFDALQRPLGIEVKSDGANNNNPILASRQYQYNLAGNITQQSSDLGQTQYAYDKLSRLTQASPDQTLQNLGLPQERYGYDPVGNRISSANQPGQWSYNQDNQLLQYPRKEPFSASAPTQTQVSYTPQGHTAQEKATAGNGQPAWQRDYRYDAAERLVEITQNGQTVRYRYDPMGRRISKSSSSGTASANTTYYLYSDTGLMAEADAQGVVTKAYGWNPESAQAGLWSTEPLWQAQVSGKNGNLTDAATRYDYLHTDHLGTPVLATTKDGATSWRGVSEAFGATATTVNAIEMNLRFPGQYWDEETQSHYNYFRDYRPELGRYTQSDPIGLTGGWNRFSYVGGDPVRYTDPTGEIGVPGAIYGGIAGGIGGYISSGGSWQGTLYGAGAGAAIGAINPWASHWAGGAAGAAAASLAGQGAALIVGGKDWRDRCNYDFTAAAGAALGGALGGPLNRAIGRYGPQIRLSEIGRVVGSQSISRAPALTLGSGAEGVVVGAGELAGAGRGAGQCGCP